MAVNCVLTNQLNLTEEEAKELYLPIEDPGFSGKMTGEYYRLAAGHGTTGVEIDCHDFQGDTNPVIEFNIYNDPSDPYPYPNAPSILRNIYTPTYDTDAANKKYVDEHAGGMTQDEADARYLSLSGGAIKDASGNYTTIQGDQIQVSDYKRIAYATLTPQALRLRRFSTKICSITVDDYGCLASMAGEPGGMATLAPFRVLAPTELDHAANKEYVDSKIQFGTQAPSELEDGVVFLVYE